MRSPLPILAVLALTLGSPALAGQDKQDADPGKPVTERSTSVGDAAKLILMSLALMPDTGLTGEGIDTNYGNDNFWANNAADERCPFRGGGWYDGGSGGVFNLNLSSPRSNSWTISGGRSAFVKLPAEA